MRVLLLALVLACGSCEKTRYYCAIDCHEHPCPGGTHCAGYNRCEKDKATANT